eukprot:6789192-Prymnesium_polylepis.1
MAAGRLLAGPVAQVARDHVERERLLVAHHFDAERLPHLGRVYDRLRARGDGWRWAVCKVDGGRFDWLAVRARVGA